MLHDALMGHEENDYQITIKILLSDVVQDI